MKTLSSVIERLTVRGFTAHFGVVGNRLRAFASGKTFGAHEVVIHEYHRFEGVSDPDDMAIVYAIESLNGTRGSLVDAFGVYSNPAVSAFLEDVPIRRTLRPGELCRGRWFAVHPSGTEDVYKLYAEGFKGRDHLARIQEAAHAVIQKAFQAGAAG